MVKKIKQSVESESDTAPVKHQDIGEVILKFYMIFHNRKPDRVEYKSGYKLIQSLMYPEESYLRSYSAADMIYAFNQMKNLGLSIKSPKMLYIEHLLPSFIDKDIPLQTYIINKLKHLDSLGIYEDSTVIESAPEGW